MKLTFFCHPVTIDIADFRVGYFKGRFYSNIYYHLTLLIIFLEFGLLNCRQPDKGELPRLIPATTVGCNNGKIATAVSCSPIEATKGLFFPGGHLGAGWRATKGKGIFSPYPMSHPSQPYGTILICTCNFVAANMSTLCNAALATARLKSLLSWIHLLGHPPPAQKCPLSAPTFPTLSPILLNWPTSASRNIPEH